MAVVDIYNTDKKYGIIYADPPWQYVFSQSSSRAVTNHYPVMTPEEMNAVPVKDIADENAVCLMWATMPKLEDAIDLMKEWGFRYSTTAFVWIKQNKKTPTLFWGMGYYTRSNAEILLLGIKGKPLERYSHSVHQVIMTPIERHSKKPDIVRDKIVELFGGGVAKIELFARQYAEGWDCWGNEVCEDLMIEQEDPGCKQITIADLLNDWRFP